MRAPNDGTGTQSGHGSAIKIARWWHSQHDTSSHRTPLARMLFGLGLSRERESQVGEQTRLVV
jgi:hypothetical protein